MTKLCRPLQLQGWSGSDISSHNSTIVLSVITHKEADDGNSAEKDIDTQLRRLRDTAFAETHFLNTSFQMPAFCARQPRTN